MDQPNIFDFARLMLRTWSLAQILSELKNSFLLLFRSGSTLILASDWLFPFSTTFNCNLIG
jgi:hypothetical protein